MVLFTTKHVLQTRRVYEGDIISLRVDNLQTDEGSRATREVVEHNGGVVIACQPNQTDVLLVRQYRYSIDCELIELPAGRIELGEEPLLAAQRELVEETGYQAEEWSRIAAMVSAPGFCNEMLYLYRAEKVHFVGKQLDDDEETEVLSPTLEEAWRMVLSGEINDAKTIAGLALLIRDC